MNKRIFKFQELDREDGTLARHLTFTDVTFSPLSYSELRDAKLSQPMTIPLHGHGATIVSSDIDGVSVNQVGHIRTSLETPFTSRAIGLVKGGWLPSALAVEDDTIVLPDRCVVAALQTRLRNGTERNSVDKDFLDLFSDQPVRIVCEGSPSRRPSEVSRRPY